MSPAQPVGDPAPIDGLIPGINPSSALERSLSFYVHVPYCRVRCGYCDFNTYTSLDFGDGVGKSSFVADTLAEIDFAEKVLEVSGYPHRKVHSIFFGGGTPSQLPAAELVEILQSLEAKFEFEPGIEVTTEANPDNVDLAYLKELKAGGFTRVSFGMQSAVPAVLKVLDRTHNPENIPQVVAWAKEAGLQVSVDLIYGAPGESLTDWRTSVEAAIAVQPDHISAYSLIIEEGTKLAAQIRRGEYTEPDDDLMADMYELSHELLTAGGYHWYEISNYARGTGYESRHNKAYWKNQDWWGFGPGAHSHVDGVRWWNLKHPVPYAQRVRAGESPAAAREVLDTETRGFEEIMLLMRTNTGVSRQKIREFLGESEERAKLKTLLQDGLIFEDGANIVLTDHGRLLGDYVTRQILF